MRKTSSGIPKINPRSDQLEQTGAEQTNKEPDPLPPLSLGRKLVKARREQGRVSENHEKHSTETRKPPPQRARRQRAREVVAERTPTKKPSVQASASPKRTSAVEFNVPEQTHVLEGSPEDKGFSITPLHEVAAREQRLRTRRDVQVGVIREIVPEEKPSKSALIRWASKKFIRPSSNKAGRGKATEKLERKSTRPSVSLFTKKEKQPSKEQPLFAPAMERAQPARPLVPAKPTKQLIGPFRPPLPEQIKLKVDSLFALTVYTDPAYENVRPLLTRYLEKNYVGEVAHFMDDLAKFSPENPPNYDQAKALFDLYITDKSKEQLNLINNVVIEIATLLEKKPFNAGAFYDLLTLSKSSTSGHTLQHNLFESSRGQLLDFPAYYATLPSAPPHFGERNLSKCLFWMRDIYADDQYKHLRQPLTDHMHNPMVGAAEVVDFLEAIAPYSENHLPTPEKARELCDRFITFKSSGNSLLFADSGDALNITDDVKRAAEQAVDDGDMKAFWAIVVGGPDQTPAEDADAILPQLAVGMPDRYASFLDALEGKQ